MAIEITILFLGPARDMTGVPALTLVVPRATTVNELRGALAHSYPKLAAALPTIRVAVNEFFVSDDHGLEAGDEVALIPPVSGGTAESTWTQLMDGSLPLDQVLEFVAGDPSLGGIATFYGATRAENDAGHGQLLRLEYEAYRDMAERQLQTLAEEARSRWAAGRVVILHRLGAVPPGEVSVVIAVACPHRAEAFEACRWLIDTLKKEVTLWKKDVFADGFERWVEPPTQA